MLEQCAIVDALVLEKKRNLTGNCLPRGAKLLSHMYT